MSNKINVTEIAFEIVALAGDARAILLQVLNDAREAYENKKTKDAKMIKDFTSQIKEAADLIIECHNKQTDLLQAEAAGSKNQVNFLMVHAQDHLMTTMLLKEQVPHLLMAYGIKI